MPTKPSNNAFGLSEMSSSPLSNRACIHAGTTPTRVVHTPRCRERCRARVKCERRRLRTRGASTDHRGDAARIDGHVAAPNSPPRRQETCTTPVASSGAATRAPTHALLCGTSTRGCASLSFVEGGAFGGDHRAGMSHTRDACERSRRDCTREWTRCGSRPSAPCIDENRAVRVTDVSMIAARRMTSSSHTRGVASSCTRIPPRAGHTAERYSDGRPLCRCDAGCIGRIGCLGSLVSD
jgi:hypothetical protein